MDALAVSPHEQKVIELLRQLEHHNASSHRLMHCHVGRPENLPINCPLPALPKERAMVAQRAQNALPKLFQKLPLSLRPGSTAGKSDMDYGSHEMILNFDHTRHQKKKHVGEKVFGEYENAHSVATKQSITGLTKETENDSRNLSFCKTVVQSMCALHLPHPIGFIRINPIRGAMTTPHTDNMRGPTVNLVNFHSESSDTVDARMMVKTWPEFRTSVVSFGGDLCIPFQHTEVEDELILTGPGKSTESHLPQDCVGKKIKSAARGWATYFKFPAKVLGCLKPFGRLNFAVLGTCQGKLQTIPFLNALDSAGTSFASPKAATKISFEDAIMCASVNRHQPECSNIKALEIGNKANVWHQFYGWRFIHWFEGDPMVPRTHVFFRFVRENNSGGSLTEAEGKKNYVNKANIHTMERTETN